MPLAKPTCRQPTEGVRLAVLTAILDPYKTPIYRHFSRHLNTLVILSGSEDNRRWATDKLHEGLHTRKARGVTIKRNDRDRERKVFDSRYLHINPGYLWELARFRPDAVITSELGLRSGMGLLYGLLMRKPVWVWLEATLHTERDRSSLKKVVRKYVFAKATRRWISAGDACTEYLHSLGVAHDRIVQVQLTTDESPYTSDAAPAAISAPSPRALVVGQLISRKGLDQLLDAMGSLKDEGITCGLVLVGDGPEADRILVRAKSILGDNLIHFSYVSPEQMPSVYKACDFLVFPTLQDVWGLVVSEAILSGLPVISSIHAGCTAEIVAPDNRFDPLDPREFKETLRRAIRGDIEPSDPTRLRSTEWVAATILQNVLCGIGHTP